MNNENYVLNTLSADAYWSVNKVVARRHGIENATFISELIYKYKYWKSRKMLDDQGGFFLTSFDIQAVLGVSERAAKRLTKSIQETKLVRVKKRGNPAKNYWYIQFKELSDVLTSEAETVPTSEIGSDLTSEAETVPAITKKTNKKIRTKSSPDGERTLTEYHDDELNKAIVYILRETGVPLKPDKHLKIWWYNAIKTDGLPALKFMIKNFCHNEANKKIGKWDWISFFKYQAKRANFAVADLRVKQHPEPDDDGIPEEVRRLHREAAGV